MANAYGFIEIAGVVAATTALDIMCKAADVKFVTWQRKVGGRLITIVVEGRVADVQEAIQAARVNGVREPVSTSVIANPHPEIVRMVRAAGSEGAFENPDIPDIIEIEGGNENGSGSFGNDRDEGSDSGD